MKLLFVLLILVVAVGGGLYAAGIIKVGDDGLQVDTQRLEDATTLDDYSKGDLAYGQANWGEALGLYKEALANDPGSDKAAGAYYRIAQCYENTENLTGALATYREFLVAYPTDPQAAQAKSRIEFLLNTGVK